ncbi:hypothetical protein WICPIJ_003994 [Wickerhamomyces pijperi]|uniref:Transcription regulator Rua1 C-terminal domain-containing protein n=1 Tax=Wickerhamomyces pijperi TaxID=599730 RepID=A0A9P8Q6U2_WICPI|nr:hypothetical protein WICPIJ_003994 [Wickerhamomyces pijperi]
MFRQDSNSLAPLIEPPINLEDVEHSFLHEPFTSFQLQVQQTKTSICDNIEEFRDLCEIHGYHSMTSKVFEYHGNSVSTAVDSDVDMVDACPSLKLVGDNGDTGVMAVDPDKTYYSSNVAILKNLNQENICKDESMLESNDSKVFVLCPICDPFEDRVSSELELEQYFFNVENNDYDFHLKYTHGFTSQGYKANNPYCGLVKIYGETSFGCMCPYVQIMDNGTEIPCGQILRLNWSDSLPLDKYLEHVIGHHNPELPLDVKTTLSRLSDSCIPNFLPINDFSYQNGLRFLTRINYKREFPIVEINTDEELFEYAAQSVDASDTDWVDGITADKFPGGFTPRRVRQISKYQFLLQTFIDFCIDRYGDILVASGADISQTVQVSLNDLYLYCVLGQGGGGHADFGNRAAAAVSDLRSIEEYPSDFNEDEREELGPRKRCCTTVRGAKYPDLLIEVLSNYIKSHHHHQHHRPDASSLANNSVDDIHKLVTGSDHGHALSEQNYTYTSPATVTELPAFDSASLWGTILKSELFKDIQTGKYVSVADRIEFRSPIRSLFCDGSDQLPSNDKSYVSLAAGSQDGWLDNQYQFDSESAANMNDKFNQESGTTTSVTSNFTAPLFSKNKVL